jgi:hypothetical protein
VKIRSKRDALAAYAATLSDGVPEGYSLFATTAVDLSFMLEDGECIWHVGLSPEDEAHIIVGGESTFLGPDGKLWTFPSSPNFFDHEIAERALLQLYLEGVADLVDAGALAERVAFITRQRDGAIYGLPDAARRGELGQTPYAS